MIEYLNKWKNNKSVSINEIVEVYNDGATKDVTKKYANGGGVVVLQKTEKYQHNRNLISNLYKKIVNNNYIYLIN